MDQVPFGIYAVNIKLSNILIRQPKVRLCMVKIYQLTSSHILIVKYAMDLFLKSLQEIFL